MRKRNPTLAQLMAEVCRLRLMRGLEEHLHDCGFGRVAGVDEAGRGALAGPVAAAAVVVDPNGPTVPGVDDSKRLGAAQRGRLAARIRRAHPTSAVALVPPTEIDRINVLEATRLAMRRALEALEPSPDLALVDAVPLPGAAFPVLPVIRGDHISYAVACASILAKVARDRLMTELDADHPQYGFASNKGYGAAEHLRALADYGPSEAHRLTFRSVLPRAARARSR